MADVTLSDGREVNFDLYQITQNELRSLFDPDQSDKEGDMIYAKCCDLTVEELGSLPVPDFRKLTKTFFEKVREPLADPS